MKIEQIDWRNENLLELLMDDNVYFIKVVYRSDKNSDEKLPYPYGVAFSRLNNAKFRDLIPMLDNNEAIVVRLTVGA